MRSEHPRNKKFTKFFINTPHLVESENPQKYTPSAKIILKNLFPPLSMVKNRHTYNRKFEKKFSLLQGNLERWLCAEKKLSLLLVKNQPCDNLRFEKSPHLYKGNFECNYNQDF